MTESMSLDFHESTLLAIAVLAALHSLMTVLVGLHHCTGSSSWIVFCIQTVELAVNCLVQGFRYM